MPQKSPQAARLTYTLPRHEQDAGNGLRIRIEPILFTLDWLQDVELRRRAQVGWSVPAPGLGRPIPAISSDFPS